MKQQVKGNGNIQVGGNCIINKGTNNGTICGFNTGMLDEENFVSNNTGVVITGDKIILNGDELPPLPKKEKVHTQIVNGNKIIINNYVWTGEMWKKRNIFSRIFQ